MPILRCTESVGRCLFDRRDSDSFDHLPLNASDRQLYD